MTKDVKNWIYDNWSRESIDILDHYENTDADEVLYDELWADDEITGNGQIGHYFKTELEARMAVFGNPENSKLLVEALEEFGNDTDSYKRALKDAHYADTTIRCYLLSVAIHNAFEMIRG